MRRFFNRLFNRFSGRLLTAAAAALPALGTAGEQPADSLRCAFPVRGVAGYYAANFGEIRSGHFHAGVDIKTDGVEGKPVVAIADGYLSRAVITPYGYGRALYLTLSDGRVAVYGHLQRFRDDVAACIEADRRARQSNDADLWFPAARWPVKRGEVIGYSGNSGSSGGPHLHFELREAGSQRRLNTVRNGLFHPKDRRAPLLMQLHYVEVDTLQEVCFRSEPVTYPLLRDAKGSYRLLHDGAIPVGRKGYFLIEASDRRDDVGNTFGVWRVTLQVDGAACFEYRMDGFLPDQSRCSDAVSWFARQSRSRNEVIRLARLERAPEEFYPIAAERGLVRTEAGQVRDLRIEVEDDCGNCSQLDFRIIGREGCFRAEADTAAQVLRADRFNRVILPQRASALLPAGALYENCFCRPESRPAEAADSGTVILSPAVRLLDAEIPLFRATTVSLRADLPAPLRFRAALATSPDGKRWSFAGGACDGTSVTASLRKGGWGAVIADTLPPRIRPLFAPEGGLSRAKSLRFTVRDNFAGVTAVTLQIDGEWVPCDRLPMKHLFLHTFDTPPAGRRHAVRFTATDAVGNTACWEGSFYR